MLNFALKYLSLGFSIIPLRPCSKEPLINWSEFQKRRASVEEATEWWTKWPDANLGIVTGLVSGVVVVDLDGPEGLESAKKLGLRTSVQTITGRGTHLWYRYPNSNVQNAVKVLPGIDIRGDGGFIVAPPSIHETGLRYRWLNNGVVNVELKSLLPIFPEGLCTVTTVVTGSHTPIKEESWIATALKEMTNGNIDTTLHRICSRLRADNYSSSDALFLLRPHAERVGATPGHLEEKIENVWSRYEPNVKKSQTVNASGPLTPGIGRSVQDGGLVIHAPSKPESWDGYKSRLGESRNEAESLKTGYPKLDSMLNGGLKSSRLFTIAARTGVGKTNFLIGIARSLCRGGKKVLLFSTEMPYAQIWERYIATLKAPEEFNRHELYVCDSFAPNLERVEEAINEIKPDVFMFDHINHVSEEQRELGTFMQGLNFLRRKYDTAGIVTAQLNRQADWVDIKTGEKVTPRMSMIKGSGTIEQASSRVLLLSETRVTPEYTEIVGNLDKNDNGPKGLIHFGLYTNPYIMREL